MSYTTYPIDSDNAEPRLADQPRKRFPLNLAAMGCVACIGFGAWILLAGNTSLDEDDLAYLPEQSNVVVQVQVDELCQSELYQGLRQQIANVMPGQMPKEARRAWEEFEQKVDRITIGVKAPHEPSRLRQPDLAGVIRTKEDMLLNDLVPGEARASVREETVNGKKLLYAAGPQADAGFCQIDSRTIAFGTLHALREVLRRNGSRATLSAEMENALAEADFSQVFTLVTAVPEGYLNQTPSPVQLGSLQAFVIGADVDEDFHVRATLMMHDGEAADQLAKAAESFLELMKGQRGPQGEVLDSLKISSSGSNVTASVTIPGQLLHDAVAKLARTFNSVAQDTLGNTDYQVQQYGQ